MHGCRLPLCGLALGFLVSTHATAVPLWELEGTKNHVYLLGSVHFLRAEDYPLPEVITKVYDDADLLVFELDLSSLDPIAVPALLQDIAVDPNGRSLEDFLGARDYEDARRQAAELDIDLTAMRAFEPWFAAMQITDLRLRQLGFDSSYGIEFHLTTQAVTDGKEIGGLETLEEQLSSLDSLPPVAQREFLLQTLEDAGEIDDDLDAIITAWRTGDTVVLEEELLSGIADQAELYDRILVARNRNWTQQILEFTGSSRNYLVIVGALHLVGDDSVLKMLEDAGFPARKID